MHNPDGAAKMKRISTATSNMVRNQNKAVVAFLDGRRMKGYIRNFSAQQDHFHLFFEQDAAQREATEVQMKDLKAIFFSRDFIGNSEYNESQERNLQSRSHKAEVTFRDGEKLVGATEAYHPQKVGFFLVPAGPRSTNLRVFVITKNATHIRWI